MIRKVELIILMLLLLIFPLQAEDIPIILNSKQIIMPNCPGAFNPSLTKLEEGGFLLVFRYCPDRINEGWVSYIGVVRLNEVFEPVSEPQLLSVRRKNSKTPSQSEDARIFSYFGRHFVFFNDNLEIKDPSFGQRRDIYLAELLDDHGHFSLSSPMKLIHDTKYNEKWWQKNWMPFEWNQRLLLVYSIDPHEIIDPNFIEGICHPFYTTSPAIPWYWGDLRGGTPAILVDNQYLSFFHSSLKIASDASFGMEMWHYFMGAYAFSPEPPFQITHISPEPIIGKGFYTHSNSEKRVIFPSGCIYRDPYIYVSYGKDDKEMWIATIDKDALMKSLRKIH